jgi:hypothetical protein
MKRTLTATNQDSVKYKVNNHYFNSNDDAVIQKNLNSHYDPQIVCEVEKIIVNPQEVLDGILKKLTPLEKFIINEHCRYI